MTPIYTEKYILLVLKQVVLIARVVLISSGLNKERFTLFITEWQQNVTGISVSSYIYFSIYFLLLKYALWCISMLVAGLFDQCLLLYNVWIIYWPWLMSIRLYCYIHLYLLYCPWFPYYPIKWNKYIQNGVYNAYSWFIYSERQNCEWLKLFKWYLLDKLNNADRCNVLHIFYFE